MNTMSQAPVVLAVDGTPGSTGALRYACREALLRGVRLHVVHVTPVQVPPLPMGPVPPIDLETPGRAILQRAVREVEEEAPGLEVTTELVVDARVHGIVAVAEGAQLVVLGRETRRGLERLLTGATTAGVAAKAPCPTVAVPDSWSPRAAATPRVVVGLRAARSAHHVLAAAFAWAEARGGSVSVVHAWELEDPYIDKSEARTNAARWEKLGMEVIDEALAEWRTTYVGPVEGRVIHGQPAAVLARAAEDADLLMLRRAHEHRPWDHLGATVRALLLMSPTPVMVVPSTPTEKEDARDLERAGAIMY
jgi:nucleotide-binding universal stress UspA family protein